MTNTRVMMKQMAHFSNEHHSYHGKWPRSLSDLFNDALYRNAFVQYIKTDKNAIEVYDDWGLRVEFIPYNPMSLG